jgi:subtilisin family serine protease
MSFSIPKTPAVKRIIREAEKDGVIVFVAASNNGANTARSFPATLDTVLCIHANDGKGNKGSMNPEPEPNRDNLSTLGVAVPSVWENGVYLSGTSYATPVAAAITAVILCFVEAAVTANQMPNESKEEAFDREGMKGILLSMSVLRDGYNCIVPWREFLPPGAGQDVLIASIRNALN